MVLVMDLNNLPFVDVPVIQKNVDSKLGIVLGDIESRMPSRHQYKFPSDLITWAHETTHGLNSNIRNANFQSGKTVNAFYVLDGKALLMEEPKGFGLSDIAPIIPSELRGGIYKMYMIEQQRSWNDRPLYTWDEWVAYANGTATRTDLKIANRNETVVYMWEMAVYGSYVAMKAANQVINDCLYYMLNRTQILYYSSKGTEQADQYLIKVKATNGLIEYWDSIGFRFTENV